MWLVWDFAQWASEQEKLLAQQGSLHVLAPDGWMFFLGPVWNQGGIVTKAYPSYFSTSLGVMLLLQG